MPPLKSPSTAMMGYQSSTAGKPEPFHRRYGEPLSTGMVGSVKPTAVTVDTGCKHTMRPPGRRVGPPILMIRQHSAGSTITSSSTNEAFQIYRHPDHGRIRFRRPKPPDRPSQGWSFPTTPAADSGSE